MVRSSRQFVSSCLRTTPGSARGRRLGLDVGVVERLVATNDGDAGAAHVVHLRRGASSAQRPPFSSGSQRRRLTAGGEPLRMTAGRRKWSRLLVTWLQSARHVDRISVPTSAVVDVSFKTASVSRRFRNATIRTSACACETVRPERTQ